MLSPALVAGAEVAVAHTNSEFPADVPANTRFSDHDPLLVRLASELHSLGVLGDRS